MSNGFREDNYLPCSDYRNHPSSSEGFTSFNHSNGQFYFSILDASGDVLFRSEGYSDIPGRDNGINSVKSNMNEDEQYSTKMLMDGRWVLSLKAKNHQEIARSCPYATEAEAKALLPSERAKAAALASKKSEAVEDDYLVCGEYREQISQTSTQYPGFISFTHTNGKYYFAMVDGQNIQLRSEGYATESARNKGIESVIRNKDLEERYSMEAAHGIFFTILKAGNHQEIGRSCPYKSIEEARAIFPSERAKAAALASKKSEAVEDDYLVCGEYREQISQISTQYPGFISFTHSNGKYYFAMVDDQNIQLRSEGYATESARNNGIESVIRNKDLEERYSLDSAHGIFFTVLKAGNHQEIGRSCPYKSIEEARAIFPSERAKAAALVSKKGEAVEDDYLVCGEYREQISQTSTQYPGFISFTHSNGKCYFAMVDGQNIQLRSEGYATVSARNNGIESVIRNKDLEERYSIDTAHGIFFTVLKAGNHQEIGRSCPYKSMEEARAIFPSNKIKFETPPPLPISPAVAPLAPITPIVKKEVEDNYLHCKEYQGHPIADKENRVAFFKHDREFYFVIYKEDGTVRLRSEGFESAESRDKELAPALMYLNVEERYTIIRNGDMHIKILKDASGREVGRSCLEKEVVVVTPPPPLPFTPILESKAAAPIQKDKEDDYLECKHYMGHAISDKQNKVAYFQHDGQYYFVIYNGDGSVRLRSEGFKKTSERDSELSAALRYLNDKKQYTIVKKADYELRILKDKTGREVGRSCLEKIYSAVPPPPFIKPVMAMAEPIAEEKAASRFPWWWLLLLLLPLLWFFFRGCDGCNKSVPPPPPLPTVKVDTAVPPPAPPTPAPPPLPVCKCDGMNHYVFDLVGKSNPKVLNRLGSNPEFGSLHDMTATEVLAKFQSRSKSNRKDQEFLNGVFKSLGYSGFSDITVDMISEVELPRGIVGNIGYSKEHKSLYAQLDNEPRDLMAFKFKGANGCDLHFMKTCGNFMFFCPSN